METKDAKEQFERFKSHIGTYDIDGKTISAARLRAWADDPQRELICIFCGGEPIEKAGFVFCQRCREYKGVGPNTPHVIVEGKLDKAVLCTRCRWSGSTLDCEFGHDDFYCPNCNKEALEYVEVS